MPFDLFHALVGQAHGGILWWQMCLRGVLVFVVGVLLVRWICRPAFGKQSAIDIVLSIIIGSNLSRTLTGTVPLLPTLVATVWIGVCFWAFNQTAARSRWFGRWVKGDPIWLCRNGALDEDAMRRAGVSRGDLEEAARRSGFTHLANVRTIVLERSGRISVSASADA